MLDFRCPAVFLPGALFLLSKWYTKKEIAVSCVSFRLRFGRH